MGKHIASACKVYMFLQYLGLWDTLSDFHLSDQQDRFIWKCSSSGVYSSSSAYRALFVGRTPIAGATRVWKIQATHRGGAACLAGLCFMVAIRSPTDYVATGSTIRMIVHFVHKR
jgi:hypothetical protein